MLPAPSTHTPSLAEVLPNCSQSLGGRRGRLGLAAADRIVVVLADGLGVASLREYAGHARTLSSRLATDRPIDAGFPTTTAAALATLTTGTPPGQHGLVGYSVLDAAHDRVVNQLTGWDDKLDPATWQSEQTVFEELAKQGIPSYAVGPERYRSTGFTAAVLRGALYRSGASIADRFAQARSILDSNRATLVYLYVPELDAAAHANGVGSVAWVTALEDLDAEVRKFSATLAKREGLLLTADHGVLNVRANSQIGFDSIPGLVDGVRWVAGEPRCLQLYVEAGVDAQLLAQRWRDAEGHRSWIATRREAIDAGWFGRVKEVVEPRIGDVLVAARKQIAYYDLRTATPRSLAMVGQHGSFSPAETSIPLLRFGQFAA